MGRGGFEPPTHGFSVRCSKNVTQANSETCDSGKEPLTPQWTPEDPKSGLVDTSKLPADLAEIVTSWPQLPDHIKAAIMALVHSWG
jgi:hypothetical protein